MGFALEIIFLWSDIGFSEVYHLLPKTLLLKDILDPLLYPPII